MDATLDLQRSITNILQPTPITINTTVGTRQPLELYPPTTTPVANIPQLLYYIQPPPTVIALPTTIYHIHIKPTSQYNIPFRNSSAEQGRRKIGVSHKNNNIVE